MADAVAKAWMNLGSLREPASLRGWVFRILTDDFISRCRATSAWFGAVGIVMTAHKR